MSFPGGISRCITERGFYSFPGMGQHGLYLHPLCDHCSQHCPYSHCQLQEYPCLLAAEPTAEALGLHCATNPHDLFTWRTLLAQHRAADLCSFCKHDPATKLILEITDLGGLRSGIFSEDVGRAGRCHSHPSHLAAQLSQFATGLRSNIP